MFDEWATISKFYESDKIKFILKRDLMYRTLAGSVYVVPKGTISDLGSIPRVLWVILPSHEYPSAFILHDYFCYQDWISRKDGDLLFLEALKASNATNWKAYIMYCGVRAYAVVRRIK